MCEKRAKDRRVSDNERNASEETDLKEYKVQKRGGSGVKTAKVTPKTGKLIVAKVLTEKKWIDCMSKKGK